MKKNPQKQIQTILEGNLSALAKRVESGKTLTASQLAMLQKSTPDAGAVIHDDGANVGSHSELARRLQISRQLISWHAGRDGAPRPIEGRHSLAAWRTYLSEHGRRPMATASNSPRDTPTVGESNAAGLAVSTLLDSLKVCIEAALDHAGMHCTDRERDAVVLGAFKLLAHVGDEHLAEHGYETVSRDEEGLTAEIPESISIVARREAKRLNKRLKGRKQRGEAASESRATDTES